MNRSLALNDGTLGVRLILTGVTLDHLHSFHNGPLFGALDFNDLAALAFFGTSDHNNVIAFFHMKFLHNLQMTSGAKEMIFMNFLSRSSRATGPKMRVPRGF